MTDYLGIFKTGNMQDVKTWPYIVYPQLLKKKLHVHSKEYRIVNDAFIFAIIWFIERDFAKRISEEATTKISKVGAYYF